MLDLAEELKAAAVGMAFPVSGWTGVHPGRDMVINEVVPETPGRRFTGTPPRRCTCPPPCPYSAGAGSQPLPSVT